MSDGGVTEVKKYLISVKSSTPLFIKVGNFGFAISTPFNNWDEGYCGFILYTYVGQLFRYTYVNGEWSAK